AVQRLGQIVCLVARCSGKVEVGAGLERRRSGAQEGLAQGGERRRVAGARSSVATVERGRPQYIGLSSERTVELDEVGWRREGGESRRNRERKGGRASRREISRCGVQQSHDVTVDAVVRH